RSFDVETQRTHKQLSKIALLPVSEVAFGEEPISLFRQRYLELFGGATGSDSLYEVISSGKRYQGQEHWLPLFHKNLETIFDYIEGGVVSLDHKTQESIALRADQINEHYLARIEGLNSKTFGGEIYKPIPPEQLYLTPYQFEEILADRTVFKLSPYDDDTSNSDRSFMARKGRNFTLERQNPSLNIFDAVVNHIHQLQRNKKKVIITTWTAGARERLVHLLIEHGCRDVRKIENFEEIKLLDCDTLSIAVLGLEEGFETDTLAVISEQDILGDRLVRPRRKSKKASNVLFEATSLSVGDLVVHEDHGIGQFSGLITITALGTPHDCLEIIYAGGDKLFLPVENLELLSRYGSEEGNGSLDRLGSSSWQSRKAKLKKRLRDIADELLKIAALRKIREAPSLVAPSGSWDEFVARFPYDETEDQLQSISSVLEDLGSGRPMDRLICGDVGFGKTEIAIRAAFVVALSGLQVAVVVPTTLLSRQHYKTFTERFKGYPVNIAQASRLVSAKELAQVKSGLKAGTIDIVVGTHALLGKSIEFARLGLIVVDEEQHFGVHHKEKLKRLKEDVHVLTLSATPIPRTLQLALSGVRELSLITTPPVDRLSVRTYISPFDPIIIVDALKREQARGGQSFYVVPRISDMNEIKEFLTETLPDFKLACAHGQMSPTELEDIMNAYYEGKFDILLSTAIVESGLDVPNANTLIVHRADMFGLSQLYQLRGRVGRSKRRAYAYFTTATNQPLTQGADKRLKVLHSLDTLGAGFTLASMDLDIRGAGNLLGEEQSGHIREVGFELYQTMLEEAIQSLQSGDSASQDDRWSPEISISIPAMIPNTYISDLNLRLGLYRRLSTLETRADIDVFSDELIDRFGEYPEEVVSLLDIMEIKGLCRMANISKIDAGPKGALLCFRKNNFVNTEGLAQFLIKEKARVKMQPDHKLVFKADWDQPKIRIKGIRDLVAELAIIADNKKNAA
ncbi:MAG: transcription-repair coupling factor, partial [Hyphomicrobium sp.]